jgi:hypothetical protein
LFALAAVVALATIGPKYIRRQQRLDLQQHAREKAYRERATGQQAGADAVHSPGATERANGGEGDPVRAGPDALGSEGASFGSTTAAADDERARVRFWIMMGVATAVLVIAWGVLAWQTLYRR